MVAGYLKEEELLDAMVVDSEGYICGRVDSFEVEPGKIMMKLYGMEKKTAKVPVVEKLVDRLLSFVPKKGFFGGKPSTEDLHEQIRRDLGLSASAPVSTKELVAFAEKKKVAIPTEEIERETRVDAGSVDWTLIDKVGLSDLGKCVLLKEPVEARKRGIEAKEEVPYYGTDYLSGRLVIDANAKIIGSAKKVLFSVGAPPGMLIQKEKTTTEEFPDIDALLRELIPSTFKTEKELYATVAEDLNLTGRLTASEIRERHLIPWAQSRGMAIPKRVEEKKVVEREFQVDWPTLDEVGDVVLLNKPIEEFTLAKKPEKIIEEAPEEAPIEKPEEEPREAPREEWWLESPS